MLHVLSYLSPSDLTPVSKDLLYLFRSDILWKPCVAATSRGLQETLQAVDDGVFGSSGAVKEKCDSI